MKVNLMYLKLYSLVIIFTASSYAQDLIGVIDLNNGRKTNVIIQKSDNTDIHFIEYKSKKKFVVPADKVNSIKFISEYNFDNFRNEINFTDEAFINFENEIKKYSNFMFVNNNLLNYFYDYLDYVFISDRFENSLIYYINILGSVLDSFSKDSVLKKVEELFNSNNIVYNEIKFVVKRSKDKSCRTLISENFENTNFIEVKKF